jgi:hypothetical protein
VFMASNFRACKSFLSSSRLAFPFILSIILKRLHEVQF